MKPLERRAPGRPKTVTGTGSSVSSWVSTSLHDQLLELAKKRDDRSMSGVIREALQRAVDKR